MPSTIRMKMIATTLLACAVALCQLSARPAWAGVDEGFAAYHRGDYTTALRELRPLAEQGDTAAQYNLGFMYGNGQGVLQDYAEALKWYRKATEQGHARAQYNLGFMYENGQGVARDYVRAHLWFNLATANGLQRAAINRDIVALRMTPAQIAQAQMLAREWWLRFVKVKVRGMATKVLTAPARGDFRVQLAAIKLKALAVKEADRLNRVHKLVFGGLTIVLVRADLGKRGVFYRLRTGPLSDRASARSLCHKLSARKQDCIVVKP